MKNVTKFVVLGLLLIPLVASINMGSAFAKEVVVDQAFGSSNVTNDKFFVPPEVTINVGDTVVWTNSDSATHTVTSGTIEDPDRWGEIFDSGLEKPGSVFKHTFDKVGEYPYICQLHPWMVGKVIVVEGMEDKDGMKDEMMLVIPTDNGSVNVEVTTDKGMVKDKGIMVDPPQQVKFDLKFLDPTTGKPLQHVNYQFRVADKSGAMVAHKMGLHVHEGMDSQSVAFSDTGSFTLMVVIEGTGINKPYDTAHSGSANLMVTVTPEFPFSVIAIMAAVVGMGVLATRIKSPLKL